MMLRIPTAMLLSTTLYQSMMPRQINKKGKSSTSDTAAPETNSRMVLTACKRAAVNDGLGKQRQAQGQQLQHQ